MSELNQGTTTENTEQEPKLNRKADTAEPPKTGQRLIFLDGTTVENASCGYSSGCLWCWFPDYTMQEAAAIVFDPEKTGKIVFEYGEMSNEYNGFTVCTNLFVEDEKISACLKRGN